MRHILVALALAAATLTGVTATPADAASCTIPAGTYLRVTSWGCGAIGWFPTGNGRGEWIGNVQSLGSSTVSVQRRDPNGNWVTLQSDQVGGGFTGVSVPDRPLGAARLREVSTGNTRSLPVYQG